MIGKFFESTLMLSSLLWEAVGACLLPALVYFMFDSCRHWRKAWWHVALAAIVFAFTWRLLAGTVSSRYYMALVLPSMLLVFHFFYHGFKKWKYVSAVLLIILFVCCLGRDFRFDPAEAKILTVYNAVQQDAAHYDTPYGIVCSGGEREGYYSGITARNMPYYCDDLPELLKSFRGNLNNFYGLCDVLYIYLRVPAKYNFSDADFTALMPEGMEIFAREYLDRRKKKELIVLKYVPREEKFDSSKAKLLPNGDFKETLQGGELQKQREYFGRRAPRFLSESPQLPKAFHLYHSLLHCSNAFGSVEKRGEKSVLHLQASGASFMCTITPFFKPAEAVIYFTVKAHADSILELHREYYTPGKKHVAYFPLILPRGVCREFQLKIPALPDKKQCRIWFQLNRGDIELSDVKTEYL